MKELAKKYAHNEYSKYYSKVQHRPYFVHVMIVENVPEKTESLRRNQVETLFEFDVLARRDKRTTKRQQINKKI